MPASFPLTLTLSLGEREQPSRRSESLPMAGFVTSSWLFAEGMVVLQLNSGVSRTPRKILPLPEGTAIEVRSADFSPLRSGPAKTAGSGLKSALLSCRNSLNSMAVLPVPLFSGAWGLVLGVSLSSGSKTEIRPWPFWIARLGPAVIEFQAFLLHARGMSGLIAIVGRPNVGKSALFNRIAGRRIAIVHDQPGVTRDRISAEAEWHGRPFTLVDTGGIGLLRGEKAPDAIAKAASEQVQLAIDSAQAIIFVVNVQEGIVPLDREVAARLRQSGKPVLVAANKVDTSSAEARADEFVELGFDRIFPVSAIHDIGISALMQTAVALLPPVSSFEVQVSGSQTDDEAEQPETASQKREDPPLKLAIVGRPNVG